MADRFNGKYRIQSARAPWWDYGWNASYFVTICTQNRTCFFGDLETTTQVDTRFIATPPEQTPPTETRLIASLQSSSLQIQLSEAGKIAQRHWQEIPERFPYAHLGEFVIMPNHIHGIVIIDHPAPEKHETDAGRDATNRGTTETTDPGRDAIYHVSTDSVAINRASTNADATNRGSTQQTPGGVTGEYNPMLHDNLSRIIRWYKGRCAFEIRKIQPDFAWQARFHDHIIRDDASFQRISAYILNNPQTWVQDRYHPQSTQS